jgi:multisubunit Na+/H+ antiporter MnhB subunit
MRAGIAAIGGVIGAVFTGLSYLALTYKHIQWGIPNPHEVVGYPEVGSGLMIVAIIGFVILAIGLAAKPRLRSRNLGGGRIIGQIAGTYMCGRCGREVESNWLICPNCGQRLM